jgi:mono/diheme cytochrome c family protein
MNPTRLCLRLALFAAAGFLGGAAQASASNAQPHPVEDYRDVRGAIVFRTYCVLCHGRLADGKGRAARHYSPPPANLLLSRTSDEYRERIIRGGGVSVGRSQFMPPWAHELTPEQINDVLHYLRTINAANPAGQ